MNNGDMPASPVQQAGTRLEHYDLEGLTKREQFAAMAMQGMLAAGSNVHENHLYIPVAIKWADSLLEELEKK